MNYEKMPVISEEEYLKHIDTLDKEMSEIYYILSDADDEKVTTAQRLLAVMNTITDAPQKAVFISGIISYYQLEISNLLEDNIRLARVGAATMEVLKKHNIPMEAIIMEMLKDDFSDDESSDDDFLLS